MGFSFSKAGSRSRESTVLYASPGLDPIFELQLIGKLSNLLFKLGFWPSPYATGTHYSGFHLSVDSLFPKTISHAKSYGSKVAGGHLTAPNS